jgi:hypothetical protein
VCQQYPRMRFMSRNILTQIRLSVISERGPRYLVAPTNIAVARAWAGARLKSAVLIAGCR